jgi:hypothetical protein
MLDAFAILLSLVLLALPIYYLWMFIASFRRNTPHPHSPPIICLVLWLCQWPFAFMSAAGCMGGGCGGLGRTLIDISVVSLYNFFTAGWLWHRTRAKPHAD